jgi:predicted metallopeptidase
MKKNYIKIVSALLVVSLVFFFMILGQAADRPFNQVVLSEANSITNGALPTFYDTIISVGLDRAGIKDQNVIVNILSDGAKEQFEGQLKAHIRTLNGSFYLFISDLDKEDAIRVICHEIVHIQQYISGDLVYQDGILIWKGQTVDLNRVEYQEREWEIDAFRKETEIVNSVEQVLWGD